MKPLDHATAARMAAYTALDVRDFAGVTDLAGFMVGAAKEPNCITGEPLAQRDVNGRLLSALADLWLRVVVLEKQLAQAEERAGRGEAPFGD